LECRRWRTGAVSAAYSLEAFVEVERGLALLFIIDPLAFIIREGLGVRLAPGLLSQLEYERGGLGK